MPGRTRTVWMFNNGDLFAGNPKWLFLYLHEHRPDITAYWLAETETGAARVRELGYRAVAMKDKRAPRLQARAGVYVVSQCKEQIPAPLAGAVYLNLWHGVGVKSIERKLKASSPMAVNIARKYIRNNPIYRNNQLFLVTSEAMEEHFGAQVGLDDDNVIRGGYPQNLYPRRSGFASYDHDVLAARGLPPDTRIALYAPTGRRDEPDFLHAALPDLNRLCERLEQTGTLLIVKVHPFMTKDPAFQELARSHADLARLMFWDNSDDVYEIFDRVDLAIVDYSSILYDLLAAGVSNVVRYVFDYDDVVDSVVDDDYDYLQLSCGPVAADFEALLDALGSDNAVEPDELAGLLARFWSYSTPDTLDRLVEGAMDHRIRSVRLPTLHTFEVFGTVLLHRGSTPASLSLYVSQRMEHSGLGFPAWLIACYPALREEAECIELAPRGEDEAPANGRHAAPRLADIHRRLADLHNLSQEQSAALQEWEIEAYRRSVVADSRMIDRIAQLRGRGDAVALLGDTCMPREVVEDLLGKVAPQLTEVPLFLSSDDGEQKRTKALFLRAYRDLPYDHAQWVHTGPSPDADVRAAEELGITARLVPPPQFNDFERELACHSGTFDGHLYAGMLQQLRREAAGSDADEQLRREFVVDHVGGYLVPYVDWVIRDAISRGYRALYFVSRGGRHLQRIADAMIAARGLDLKSSLLQGSQAASQLTAHTDDLDEELLGSGGEHLEAGLMELLLTDIRMDRVADRRREALVAYLQRQLDFSEPFACVWFGDRGPTQDCLAWLIDQAAGKPFDVPFFCFGSLSPRPGRSVRHSFTSVAQSPSFVEAALAGHLGGAGSGHEQYGDTITPRVRAGAYDADLDAAMAAYLPQLGERYAGLDPIDADELGRFVLRHTSQHCAGQRAGDVLAVDPAPPADAAFTDPDERARALGMSCAQQHASSHEAQHQQDHTLPGGSTPQRAARIGRIVVRAGFRRIRRRFASG